MQTREEDGMEPSWNATCTSLELCAIPAHVQYVVFAGMYSDKAPESLRNGFDIKYATSNWAGRFGKGLYFAPNSSKSHAYSKSVGPVQAMFLCKVVAGQVHKTLVDIPGLTQPPNGCDSVSGEVGVNLNFPELVIYHSGKLTRSFLLSKL